jgi:hypothetical protein
MDQGGQAGGEDDPAELPSVPLQRRAAMAEPDGVQLGQPVAAAGAPEEPVPNEFTAAASEDRRPAGQTCAIHATSREPTDTAAVRGDGAQDCRHTSGDRVDGGKSQTNRRQGRRMSMELAENRRLADFNVYGRALPGY